MQSTVFALGRALVSPLFIIAGAMKFMNVAGILGSTGTKNFMALIGGGAAPTWLGYLIAAAELIGGLMILVGFQDKMCCDRTPSVHDRRYRAGASVLDRSLPADTVPEEFGHHGRLPNAHSEWGRGLFGR